jgi:hypothetical protein
MPKRRPILYSLIPGCRGPSREQSREHRGFRSRLVADASGAPALRDQGPIGRPGTASQLQRRWHLSTCLGRSERGIRLATAQRPTLLTP